MSVRYCLLILLFCVIAKPIYADFNYQVRMQLLSFEVGSKLYLVNLLNGEITDSLIYNGQELLFTERSSEISFSRLERSNHKFVVAFIVEPGIITIKENSGTYEVRGGTQNRLFGEHLKNTPSDIKPGRSSAFIDLFNLWGAKNALSSHQIDSVYRTLSPSLQAHRIGRLLKFYVRSDSMKNAINIVQKDSNGNSLKISFPNKNYLLLDFWASWCGPCRQNNPQLRTVARLLKSKNFEIVSISGDDKLEAWKDAIRKDSLNWIHVSDLKGWNNQYVLEYGVRGLPTYILISPEGKILFRSVNEIEKVIRNVKDIYGVE